MLEAAEARAEELKVKNARLLESLETSERQKSATRAADSESSGFEAKLEIAKAVAVVEAAKEKEKAADIAALKSKYDDLLRHSHGAQMSAEKEASTLAKDLEKAKVGHGGSNIQHRNNFECLRFPIFSLPANRSVH